MHRQFFRALKYASGWAGFAGILATLATQLDKPDSLICYGLSALCSMMAILLKSSEPRAPRKEKKP